MAQQDEHQLWDWGGRGGGGGGGEKCSATFQVLELITLQCTGQTCGSAGSMSGPVGGAKCSAGLRRFRASPIAMDRAGMWLSGLSIRSSALLLRFQSLVQQGIFLPESTCTADSLKVYAQPPPCMCAITSVGTLKMQSIGTPLPPPPQKKKSEIIQTHT